MGNIVGMRNKSTPDSWDIREVEKAGKGLTMQAVTLSNRYISNGGLKNQFIREVDRFEQCLVNDFKSGRKDKETVFKELRKERQSLMDQGQEKITERSKIAANTTRSRVIISKLSQGI
ncbi:hypothetical protein V4D06_17800 [Vibrio mimicus]|uniref:hypothetical protein n=1 Tax=Vibrio mimicus TaxID=674 RepID=UPI002F950326